MKNKLCTKSVFDAKNKLRRLHTNFGYLRKIRLYYRIKTMLLFMYKNKIENLFRAGTYFPLL